MDALIASAVSSRGSVDNINAIISGLRNSGFAQSDVAYRAYTGTREGKPPAEDLRPIAVLFPEHVHLVALKDSGINVALAAYAAAGIAGSNPFKTGNTAFRLGIAKALVPFVFVYSPSLLLVADGFTWQAFFVTLTGAVLGIGSMGTAFAGYFIAPLTKPERWWIALTSFLFIAPGLVTMGVGLVLLLPVFLLQLKRRAALIAA